MARIWSSGFEQEGLAGNVGYEWDEFQDDAAEGVQADIVRSGNRALRINTVAGIGRAIYSFSSSALEVLYIRVYFRIASLPNSDTEIFYLTETNVVGDTPIAIKVTTGGNLQVWDIFDGAQIGSNSPTLSLNTWYMIELHVDFSTPSSTVVQARLNRTQYVNTTNNFSAFPGVDTLTLGSISNGTYDFYYDDVAINDDSGSFQNSYPGEGKIIHLRPNGAGALTAWTGTFEDIDEITPDNDTTKISSNTNSQYEIASLENSTAIEAVDEINLVALGVRFNGAGSSNNATFVVGIHDVNEFDEYSSNITPTNTTWVTNANAEPRNYPYTTYTMPGSSEVTDNPITKADLEGFSAIARLISSSTNAVQISTMWLLVEYVESVTFPIVESVTDTDFATSVTSMAVNMPTAVSSGDLLIALTHYRNAGTWSTVPTGWNNLGEQAGGGSVGELAVFYKIATGGEAGLTATWITGTGTTAAWQVLRITGWHGTTIPELTFASGDATSANPPSLNPTNWDTEDTLWLAVAGHSAASTTPFSAAPSNYSGFAQNGASSGGAAVAIAHGYRKNATDTEDPGTFTVDGSNRWWAAATIAIRPASANFRALVVAGGGGGGFGDSIDDGGGGGGAGGYKENASIGLIENTSYTITVGGGGNGATAEGRGVKGNDSSIGTVLVSEGGGGGGGGDGGNGSGGAGGSGGGGAEGLSGGAGTVGQGRNGGNSGDNETGGGGGGAGAVGSNSTSGAGGNGGIGLSSDISGSAVTRAGGGGGATDDQTIGSGGTGGGGNGGTNGGVGQNGTANTGGGGGGGSEATGGNGGSGVVIIRFPTDDITVTTSTNATETTSGSDTILTWNTSGTFEFELEGQGGEDLGINISDSITVSESLIVIINTLIINKSDNIALTEQLGFELPINLAVTDSIGVGENVNLIVPFFIINKSENITINEFTILEATRNLSVNDSISVTDDYNLLLEEDEFEMEQDSTDSSKFGWRQGVKLI